MLFRLANDDERTVLELVLTHHETGEARAVLVELPLTRDALSAKYEKVFGVVPPWNFRVAAIPAHFFARGGRLLRWQRTASVAAVGVALGAAVGVGAVLAAPPLLGSIFGITALGPVAGGLFATTQSAVGPLAAGGVMATIQSTAMAGVSAGAVASGAAAAGATGGIVGGIVGRSREAEQNNEEHTKAAAEHANTNNNDDHDDDHDNKHGDDDDDDGDM